MIFPDNSLIHSFVYRSKSCGQKLSTGFRSILGLESGNADSLYLSLLSRGGEFPGLALHPNYSFQIARLGTGGNFLGTNALVEHVADGFVAEHGLETRVAKAGSLKEPYGGSIRNPY